MAFLYLTLFGGFEALLRSGTSVLLPTKKAQALLSYCALSPGQVHQREKLATLLWGESEDANARNSLRQTLHVLRSALGENASHILRVDRDAVGAEPGAVEVDVLRLERLAGERTPQSLEQAAALYRGDLLDGIVVDEEPFEEWLLVERERLRDLAVETLVRLLQHQRVEGTATAAIHTARRLLALDPLQEIVHRLLMRLLLQVGKPEEAVHQYEVCRRVLKHELNVEPEAETTKLKDSVVAGLGTAGGGERPRPPAPEAQGGVLAAATPHRRSRAARFGELNLTYQALSARVKRDIDEARQIMQESARQHLLLRRAMDENSRHLSSCLKLVIDDLAAST